MNFLRLTGLLGPPKTGVLSMISFKYFNLLNSNYHSFIFPTCSLRYTIFVDLPWFRVFTVSLNNNHLKRKLQKCTRTMKEANKINHLISRVMNHNIRTRSIQDIQDNKKVCLQNGRRENNQSNLRNFKIERCKLENGNGLILLFRVLVHAKEVVTLLL